MSHDYRFCEVSKRRKDGDTHNLNRGRVVRLDGGDGDFIRMSAGATQVFNDATNGAWQQFLTGGPYTWDSCGNLLVLTDERRALIPTLIAGLEKMRTTVWGDMFVQLFEKMERYLATSKRQVALAID